MEARAHFLTCRTARDRRDRYRPTFRNVAPVSQPFRDDKVSRRAPMLDLGQHLFDARVELASVRPAKRGQQEVHEILADRDLETSPIPWCGLPFRHPEAVELRGRWPPIRRSAARLAPSALNP